MFPDLWTVPGVGLHIRTYGFFCAAGIVAALWFAVGNARRAKTDPAAVTTVSIIGLGLGIVGCRLMHVVHYLRDALRSGAVDAKDVVAMTGGGEILGGVLLGTAGVVGYLAIRRKPILLHMDILLPPMILGMGIGRIGCLMFGCCWGGVCITEGGEPALPWAIRFPYASPAYVRHVQEGRIEVPPELIWKSPITKELVPIPRRVLSGCDVDGDEPLAQWGRTARAYADERARDPDSDATARLADALAVAQAKMGRRSPEEIGAARHLLKLADREDMAGVSWAQLRHLAASHDSLWVHPTQLYDAVSLTLLFLLLTAILHRRRRHGMVVAWGMMLYSINRFVLEIIREDSPHDVAGLTISQLLSAAIFVAGVVVAAALARTAPAASHRREPALAS